jgi:toxin CptA
MHSAPAVSYPVGRSRFHGLLLVLIAGSGALSLSGWTYQSDPLRWHHGVAALVWLLGVAVAGWRWYRAPSGTLIWDGEVWCWVLEQRSRPVKPEVALDLQYQLLLRLSGSADRADWWVWPERGADPSHWTALRRALFARSAADHPDADALMSRPDHRHGVTG